MTQPAPAQRSPPPIRPRFDELGLWIVQEKLNHVRTIIDVRRGDHAASPGDPPTLAMSGDSAEPGAASHRLTAERVAWAMNKTAVALATCGISLLLWSSLAPRADLLPSAWAAFWLATLAGLTGWRLSPDQRCPLRIGGRFS